MDSIELLKDFNETVCIGKFIVLNEKDEVIIVKSQFFPHIFNNIIYCQKAVWRYLGENNYVAYAYLDNSKDWYYSFIQMQC